MATRMQQRRGTAAQWISANPILNVGEIGYETDTNKFKIGDGTNHWDDLNYFYDAATTAAGINALLDIDGAPELLNTLSELANALGDDPNFLDNYATIEYVSNAVAGATIDVATYAGDGLSYNSETDQLDVDLDVIQPRVANVTDTQIGFLDGVTSSIQDQFSNKQDIVSGVGDTQISYLANVTSNIQDQLDNKVESSEIVEIAQDAAAQALVNGSHTNISVSYNDEENLINITAAPGYSDQEAIDAVGNAIGSGLLFTDDQFTIDADVVQTRVANVSDTEIGHLDGVTSGIQGQIDTKVNKSGDTLTGFLTLHADPTQAMHAVTKEYTDSLASGIIAKPAVDVATTANVDSTYNNGTAGVGATLTIAPTATLTIDGKNSWIVGASVLFKNQTNKAHNGRYVLTTVGDGSNSWVFTRCGLCDEASEIPGAYIFVKGGTANNGTGWVQTVADPSTFVVGTDNIDVYQFSGAGTITAGTGLAVNGSEISFSTTAVGTFASTPSSANLASAVTDETGSGALVFGTSPTIVTPRVQLAMNAQTGTTYTLVLTDASNRWVTMNNSSAQTVTIPPNIFAVGDQISVQQIGTGQVSFAQGSGVTITGASATPSAPKIRTRYSSAVAICTASNVFTIIGDLV
jgi:hypothetical protein